MRLSHSVIVFAVALAIMLGMVIARAESSGFSLGGRVSASDQEADEGYFAIDQETMITVKPRSELHTYLRGQVGKRVRITIELETE